ncbi:NAD-dependent epimerase/dehydratase family protein [Glaciecola sp. 1036]|uniref:NAD-dependent epimerase/dehydratase family protein n=1 Tax=Alteromonadaceae TaxID=72275 RepID=UPI003CFCAB26
MKRVLLLGGNGYLGQAFSKHLIQSGYTVLCAGRSVTASRKDHHAIDLSDHKAVDHLEKLNCDLVIDFVSYVSPNSPNQPVSEIKKLLQPYQILLKEHYANLPYIFISSGGTVYGERSSPAVESDELKPISSYGIQKALQEELVNKYVKKGLILRITNPYGGGQTVKNGVGFVKYLLDSIKNSTSSINLRVPAKTVRDYIQMNDLMQLSLKLISRPIDNLNTYNLSTGQEASLRDLIEIVASIFETNLQINEQLQDFNSDEHIFYNVLNNQKVLEATKNPELPSIKKVLTDPNIDWNHL